MKKEKNQTQRIIDSFITSIILIFSFTLVGCGVAVSKINTDYMETGVRAGKIVAERESQQISVTTHDGIELRTQTNYLDVVDKILTYLPPPVNTTYLVAKEISKISEQ